MELNVRLLTHLGGCSEYVGPINKLLAQYAGVIPRVTFSSLSDAVRHDHVFVVVDASQNELAVRGVAVLRVRRNLTGKIIDPIPEEWYDWSITPEERMAVQLAARTAMAERAQREYRLS